MYMKNEHRKWGYKLFVFCGGIGFSHKIEIYNGQENIPKFRLVDEPGMEFSGNTVNYPKLQNIFR